MPTLLVRHADASSTTPLAASTLVGRGWPCVVRLRDAAVPLYWVELRWSAGWSWRALGAEERTRGPGTPRADGWRELPVGTPRRPSAIRLDERVSLELVDDGPPAPFLLDPASGRHLRGDELAPLVEVRGDALLPLAAEGDPGQALEDGELILVDGVPWRVLGVNTPLPTSRGRIDLARPRARLEVDADPLRALFTQGDATVELRGEHLRTLLVFVRARAENPAGGWFRPLDAWAAWRRAGGNADSPLERLSWDRARLRTQLHAQGVGHVEQLFEVARDSDGVRVRLALAP